MSVNHDFTARIVSGLVLAPLTIAAIFYGGLAFQAFVAIAFGLSFKEWIRMARKGDNTIRDGIIGILYIAFCFAAFLKLRLEMEQGLFLTIVLLAGVWASDIAAYFTGKFLGGPKLMPKVSPNKTWSGFIGGTLGSACTLMAMDYFATDFSRASGLESLPFAPLEIAFMIGALFTVFGQMGDLLVSWYKRRVGVKDTGTLIPGHGGILDRIDSLLFVTPFFFIVLQALGNV